MQQIIIGTLFINSLRNSTIVYITTMLKWVVFSKPQEFRKRVVVSKIYISLLLLHTRVIIARRLHATLDPAGDGALDH